MNSYHFLKNPLENSDLYAITDQVLHSRLVNYLFWGFDQTDGGINEFLINHASNKSVRQYFNFLGRQVEYFKRLTQEERHELLEKILSIYRKGLERFKSNQDDELSVFILSLLNFYDSLEGELFELLISRKYKITLHHVLEELFQNLKKFINSGEPNYEWVSELINLVIIDIYYLSEDAEKLIYNTVEVLYQKNQLDSMNQFCDSMAKKEFRFLMPLFNKYN